MISIGHRSNYATICQAIKNGHTAIRLFVDSQGLTRTMLCLVNQNGEGGATAYTPFALLIEDPSQFTALVPPQVLSQTSAEPHALVQYRSTSAVSDAISEAPHD